MRIFTHKRCRRLLLLALLLGGAASALTYCGVNPAAPPSPPAELPSALVIPDPTINVSEISSGGTSSLEAFVVGAGPLGGAIKLGPDNIGDTNLTFEAILSPLQTFTLPVGTTTTTFQTETTIFGTTLEIKFDFADFDFNGDGQKEGCSGNTAALPICMRVWVGGEQLMMAVFDHFPTADNKGSGQMRFMVPDIFGGDQGVRVAVVYDHVDPQNKTTDLSLFTPQQSFTTSYRRALITEVGPEGSAKKAINFNKKFLFDPNNPDIIQYIGSFLQNQDFWSGTLNTSGPTVGTGTLPVTCAQISTANAVFSGTCQDLGIDVTGTSFIDFATDADFAFNDFPTSPTF